MCYYKKKIEIKCQQNSNLFKENLFQKLVFQQMEQIIVSFFVFFFSLKQTVRFNLK